MLNFFKKIRKLDLFPMRYESVPNTLLGVDLDEWTYIGEIELCVNNRYSYVALFAQKSDPANGHRKYVHFGHAVKAHRDHGYITKYVERWAAREYSIYHICMDLPSKWLTWYMKETYNAVWVEDKKWWFTDNQKPTKPKTHTTEDNVIKLNFEKKPE